MKSWLFRLRRFDLISLSVLFGLSILIMLPVFVRGFPNGDDAHIHYRWASEFITELRNGAIYPRWLSQANYGHGSPALLFYPPLEFYAVALFSLVTKDILSALALGCWFALFLSGVTMYWFSRSLLPCTASLCAAVIYLLMPFHLYDLYQGSALAEFWAFAWVPLVLHAARRVAESENWRDVPLLALSYALLWLTHVPTSLSISVLLPCYILCITRNAGKLLRVSAGLTLGVGLGAAFIVPVLFERKYVHITTLLGVDYQALFLFRHLAETLKRLPAVRDEAALGYWDSNWMALAVLLLFVFSAFSLWRQRRGEDIGSRTGLLAVFMLSFCSLFLMSRPSLFIWRNISALAYLQFPYRLLLIASAGTSILAGAAIGNLHRKKKFRLVSFVFITAALILNFSITVLTVARAQFDLESFSTGEVPEYQPVWSGEEMPKGTRRTPAVVDAGDATVTAIDEVGTRQSYVIQANTESLIRFRTLYFPGWIARLDGMPAAIRPAADGATTLLISPGEHQLTLKFEDTSPRTAGKVITALSTLILLALVYSFWQRRRVTDSHRARLQAV